MAVARAEPQHSGPAGTAAARGAAGARLRLDRIEAALRDLQKAFPEINLALRDRREGLDDQVLANLLSGYAYVDGLVARGADVFAMGNLHMLLELNCRVLCGEADDVRQQNANHLRATEEHFYGAWGAGIRDVVEWHDRHRGESAWKRAAGVYIRMLSEPQLFLEGNHRTGALVMSYILLREAKPPFVLTAGAARAFFDPSTTIKKMRKRSLAMQFRMPALRKSFARFLKQNADPQYLAAA